MPIVLHAPQLEIIERTRAALRSHRKVLVQAPTGFGKTVLASFMAGQTAARGSLVNFICHRAELVQGTSGTFSGFGIGHSFVAAGRAYDARQLVQVCSIDTLKNRLQAVPEPRLALWDECHHIGAAGWAAVMAAWPNAWHVGLSATPWRLDGSGLGDFFDVMVHGPQVEWLIANGYLAPYVMYAPSVPDLKGVHKALGDFAKGETAERMAAPKLTGDAIKHWQRLADGRLTVGFCVNVAHSRHMAAAFNAAGIPAAHLDGATRREDRARIIADYASGQLRVLFNVGLFGEGFDLAAIAQRPVTIDAVLDMDPTMSLAWCMQKWGRALRTAPGKTALLLDHAGNSQRHGFPDDVRTWSLEGRDKTKAAAQDGPPPPVTCETCFIQIRRPLPDLCPGCGKRMHAPEKPVAVADADLVEMTEKQKRLVRQQMAAEQAACQTLGELIRLGKARGHEKPSQWAFKVWNGRKFKPVSGDAATFDENNF
jgi:superfamily II DNA or RNA helicase